MDQVDEQIEKFGFVHPPSTSTDGTVLITDSGRATLRHTKNNADRCYLPVLTGLSIFPLRKTRPSTSTGPTCGPPF